MWTKNLATTNLHTVVFLLGLIKDASILTHRLYAETLRLDNGCDEVGY